ncbi:MAG: hypothetical protein CBB69_000690 [Phycisphaera sp. TMED9]|nr:MAG: hypothetical protein CBB69_000690 [Phycisphaera sp. TMED9]
MNTNDAQDGSAPSILPPDDLEAKAVRWPTVLGVLSMVYAGFAFLANGCGAASPFMTPYFLTLSGLDIAGFQMAPWLLWTTVGSGGIGMIMAIVLFAGGVSLLRRRRSALKVLKAWVAITVVLTIVGLGLGFMAIEPNVQMQMEIQKATQKLVKERGGGMAVPTQTAEEMRSQSKMMLPLFGLLPLIYPVIVGFLITSRTRLEDAEAWED